jgi:hypothetical protein
MNYLTFNFVVGVLVNRTVVWRYAPNPRLHNEQSECDKVVKVASWVPEYSSDMFDADSPVDVISSVNARAQKHFFDGNRDTEAENKADYKAFHFTKIHRNTNNGEMWYHDILLRDPTTYEFFKYYLDIRDEKEFDRLIDLLYDQGHAYMKVKMEEGCIFDLLSIEFSCCTHCYIFLCFYQGMMYENTISHSPHITRAVEPFLKPTNSDEISIGIHARHKHIYDDGSDVSEYMSCVDQMLEIINETLPCHLYVASDRPKSLTAFEQEGGKRNCQVHFVDHDNEKRNVTNIDQSTVDGKWDFEHGVFAGAPFFEDLEYLANQVRSGLVHTAGTPRGSSASALYWQQIVYRGIQDGSFTHPPPDCSPSLKRVRLHDAE